MTRHPAPADLPLAIDLFCGLFQAEFRLRADAAVEQLMTGRAEYPDHVALRIRYNLPRTISLVFRLMGDLKNARLTARFAGRWDIWISTSKSANDRILEWASQVVEFLNARFAPHKFTSLTTRRFARASLTAISPVRAWRHDVEMTAALATITPSRSDVGLFFTPDSTRLRLATERTISFIWPFGLEWPGACRAKQIIHSVELP